MPNHRALCHVVLVLCLGAPFVVASDGPPSVPSRDERHRLLIGSKADAVDPRQVESPPVRGFIPQENFDVTHYLIDLTFDDAALSVSGSVAVTATSLVDGLTEVRLNLRDNMNVSSITRVATSLAFTHANNFLDITLDQPFDTGQSFSFRVQYSGSPQGGGFGSFGWNKYINGPLGEMIWSLSEPYGARNWWPSKDRPDDKALVEERYTVRSDWTATGNGELIAVDAVGGGKTRYVWRSNRPLTTYLVSIAATDFVHFSDTFLGLDDTPIPLEYYVYPEDLADAQVSFSETGPMMEFYADLFGEYPFLDDHKYGMSAFPFWGAMEHNTNTSYGYPLIDGTNQYDFIVAHEAAHQWFGDAVSPMLWADIWLNEGFASYGEALWFEHLGGETAYKNYMLQFYSSHFDGPLYDPDGLFTATTYDKGAWTQHMLRGVLGDQDFFDAQRAWYVTYRDQSAETAQYQALLETFYGASLDWFFGPWVYGANMPDYEFGHSSVDQGDGTYRTYVRVRQVQTDAGLFTMPVDLTLVTAGGDAPRRVWNDALDQDFVLETTSPVLDVVFDEDNWILKVSADPFTLPDGDADGVPDRNDNCPATVNPLQPDLDGDLLGDACDPDDDGDLLDDILDCAPLDPTQGVPGEATGLTLTHSLQTDTTTVGWSAAVRADTHDVSRGRISELSVGYGVCVAPGIPGLDHVDQDTPPLGDGYLFLVRGRDDGCGGGGPLGDDSTGAPRPSPCP